MAVTTVRTKIPPGHIHRHGQREQHASSGNRGRGVKTVPMRSHEERITDASEQRQLHTSTALNFYKAVKVKYSLGKVLFDMSLNQVCIKEKSKILKL
jgi:hypothetical protein